MFMNVTSFDGSYKPHKMDRWLRSDNNKINASTTTITVLIGSGIGSIPNIRNIR
jgi:hypothetical protein